jgi:hypothetical protein
MGKEGLNLWNTYFTRGALVMEAQVPLDPIDVRLLGPVGVVFEADYLSNYIQKLFRGWGSGHGEKQIRIKP